jgi:hypothetical protein
LPSKLQTNALLNNVQHLKLLPQRRRQNVQNKKRLPKLRQLQQPRQSLQQLLLVHANKQELPQQKKLLQMLLLPLQLLQKQRNVNKLLQQDSLLKQQPQNCWQSKQKLQKRFELRKPL